MNEICEQTEYNWLINQTTYKAVLTYYDYTMEFVIYRGDQEWVKGYLKWDGCCNFSLENNGIMAHICSLSEMKELIVVFENLYKAAQEIPNWSE